MTLLKIKDFNALIEKKPFSNQSVEEVYEKPIEMSKIDAYTTENFLDSLCYQNY